jgi:hypothetical protein
VSFVVSLFLAIYFLYLTLCFCLSFFLSINSNVFCLFLMKIFFQSLQPTNLLENKMNALFSKWMRGFFAPINQSFLADDCVCATAFLYREIKSIHAPFKRLYKSFFFIKARFKMGY